MKKRLATLLVLALIFAFSGCNTASESTSVKADESSAAQPTTKQTIEFWYHDGNPTSNPIFEELITRFEEKNPNMKVEYVGLPADSYLQKYNTAVATNTVPDVASIRDMDVATFINQNALMNMEEIFAQFDQAQNISKPVLDAVRSTAIDGDLYLFPQYITMDISWYNQKMFEEKGIEPPKTIDEFIKYCEEYANPNTGEYFYSLRGGGGSMENMFDFIFTYANEYSLFDENGVCVLNGDKYVEALDLYASIYWNGWTSPNSVTNGFKEMVADFGSKGSMYISHNSSSLAEHKKNLGDGNFMNVLAPANDQGITVTKDLSFIGYTIFNQSKNKEGASRFVEFLVSNEAASYLCQNEGRIPINDLVYEEDWFKNDIHMQVYQSILQDPSVRFIPHAIWLPQWNEFRTKYQEPGLQAVLLKERTSKEVLDEWAQYLTKVQQEYLASNQS